MLLDQRYGVGGKVRFGALKLVLLCIQNEIDSCLLSRAWVFSG